MDRITEQPWRNYQCIRYMECLTAAAMENLPLECDSCVNEHSIDPEMSVFEFLGCLRLLWALFGDGSSFEKDAVVERVLDRRDFSVGVL